MDVFKYLGRLIVIDNDDTQAVHGNLAKARRVWARISRVLRAEDAGEPDGHGSPGYEDVQGHARRLTAAESSFRLRRGLGRKNLRVRRGVGTGGCF